MTIAVTRRLATRLGRIAAWAAAAAFVLWLAAAAAGSIWLDRLGPLPIERIGEVSRLVVDRDGRLLRPFTTEDGVWRLPVEASAVDRRYLAYLEAYEDRRFRTHSGVDLAALARSAFQMLERGRIVSGGSTITMQVARLLEPRAERSLLAKLRQVLRAWELERRLSKDEILRLYLTLAPFGGNLEGVRAASLAYFGREPRRLSPGEAALLVALPQSPEVRRPDRSVEAARAARDRVLARLEAAGAISRADAVRGRMEPVPTARRSVPMLAPHLAERLIEADPATPIIRTTIDARLQAALQTLARDRAEALGAGLSIALVVVDNATGDVRAHVGSPGYMDLARAGAVDMTAALRSPGSALKPFVYALAFESGRAHPETLMEDRPIRFGSYRPENFDQAFQGTVTVREALARSLNIPVVELLHDLRPARFLGMLRGAGAQIALPREAEPGLAVGLGGLGITLEDMARLYAGLARGGETIALRTRLDAPEGPRLRLTDPVSAWYVSDILMLAPPPDGAIGGRFPFKTGTSYGYRDAWAVGYDRGVTIAVWVGRPDNGPVAGLSGRVSAAPILFDAMARLVRAPIPLAEPPGTLRVATARLPPPLRAFGAAQEALRPPPAPGAQRAEVPLVLAFPPDGARLEREDGEAITLRANGGVPPFLWLVDGRPVGATTHRRAIDWMPGSPGFAQVTVTDSQGASASIRIRVD